MTTEFTVTPSIEEFAEISIQEILNHFKVNVTSLRGRLINLVLQMPRGVLPDSPPVLTGWLARTGCSLPR